MTRHTPLLDGIAEIRLPTDAEVLAAAEMAAASHLHLITNGRDTLLSPRILPGWHKLAVRVKEAA